MRRATLASLVGPGAVNGEQLCTLLLLGHEECHALEAPTASDNETVDGCVRHRGGGVVAWSAALHPKCVRSAWWQRRFGESATANGGGHSAGESDTTTTTKGLPQNYVRRAQTLRRERQPYVPPGQRRFANITVSVRVTHAATGFAATLHPISFGFPRAMMLPRVARDKFFDIAPLTPAWLGSRKNYPWVPRGARATARSPLAADEEFTLAQLYRHSFFGFTHVRGGADCQRHLEIMARGAVPYFPDLALRCRHALCLAGYPKALLLEALALPGVEHWAAGRYENAHFARGRVWLNLRPGRPLPAINRTAFDTARYFALADRLLRFARHNMTCGAVVARMLRVAGVEEPGSVLVLVPRLADYQALCVEAGFAELGINYTTNAEWPTPRRSSSAAAKAAASPPDAVAGSRHAPGGGSGAQSWPPWEQRVPESEAAAMGAAAWSGASRRFGSSAMYGRGFTWGMRVPPPPGGRVKTTGGALAARVRAREFDLVVYAAMWFGFEPDPGDSDAAAGAATTVSDTLPLLGAVVSALPAARVVFVDGGDSPLPEGRWGPLLERAVSRGATMFVREAHLLVKEGRDELLAL